MTGYNQHLLIALLMCSCRRALFCNLDFHAWVWKYICPAQVLCKCLSYVLHLSCQEFYETNALSSRQLWPAFQSVQKSIQWLSADHRGIRLPVGWSTSITWCHQRPCVLWNEGKWKCGEYTLYCFCIWYNDLWYRKSLTQSFLIQWVSLFFLLIYQIIVFGQLWCPLFLLYRIVIKQKL